MVGYNLKIYVNTSFTGHYPVGTAAVIVAEAPAKAAVLLNAELMNQGLKPTAKSDEMEELNITVAAAHILNNGDY